MKKFLLLFLLVLIAFAVYARQRLYVRDFLGSVTRNGVREPGAQVFINFSNDVLLENDHPPRYVTLIQHGDRIGSPAGLYCIHWLVCLTDADQATLIQPLPGAIIDSMTSKAVAYRAAGISTVISLR